MPLLLLLLTLPAQEGRVPWTGGRISGSPEPPPECRVERLYPNLTFDQPCDIVLFPGGGRWVVVQHRGKIFSFRDDPSVAQPDLFMDFTKEVRGLEKMPDCKGVRETYAVAFHPKFAENRFCYVMYILAHKTKGMEIPNGSRVSRFRVTETDPPRLDPDSEVIVIDWVAGGHNGADLDFGNDGFLYVSTGDAKGPTPPDPLRTGQDVSDLMSSILRIDVDRRDPGREYAVPPDNPFVKLPGVRPEIWSYGYRNPWRMSFDRSTGVLWVGDVGWERWELVLAATRGSNYGWSVVEGPSSVHPNDATGPSPVLPATHLIPHPEAASISGGFVYRGGRIPSLRGHLLYGDWETRRIWANPVKGATLGERREIARTPLRIVGFAEDARHEHVVLDHEGGGVWSLVPNDAGAANAAFPRTLSATGLFTSTPDQAPAAGVVPYRPNAPRWADGATAQRWIAIPGLESPKLIDKNRAWPRESIWPRDSVFAKTLSLDGRKIETQVLHYDGQEWAAYAYLWNKEQTDATLVRAEGTEEDLGGGRRWRVYSRAACLTCHNPWPGRILTFNAMQLTRPGPDDPMKAFQDLGFLPREVPRAPKPLVDPCDESQPLDARARSYLAVNCAHCHRFGGGGSALIDLRAEVALKDLKAHQVRPGLGTFDLPDAHILAGGDPSRSVLLYRLAKLGRGRMPHLGSEVVDEKGVDLLARWIATLPSEPTTADGRAADASALTAFKGGDPKALDRLLASPAPAMDLLLALPGLKEPLRAEAVRRALALPSGPVRDLFERFEDPARRRKRLGPTPAPGEVLALSGDALRGRALFEGTAVQCKACHRLDRPDEMLGPDLSKIGAKYSRLQLLESILDPSKQIDPKFALVVVQTLDDAVVSGRLVSKTDAETVLRDAQAGEIRLKAASIRRMIPQSKSAMPEYLLQDLTAQEAADLIEFLASLK